MSQISAHPLVWAQSKVQCPWALFRETTVFPYKLHTKLSYVLTILFEQESGVTTYYKVLSHWI